MSPDMLVLVDSDPNSRAPLAIADAYANGAVALTAWGADNPPPPLEVVASATAQPTIGDALQTAAQRGIPWVGIRRDFAEPQQLLSDLLLATARHTDDDIPGFAVFLASGDPTRSGASLPSSTAAPGRSPACSCTLPSRWPRSPGPAWTC